MTHDVVMPFDLRRVGTEKGTDVPTAVRHNADRHRTLRIIGRHPFEQRRLCLLVSTEQEVAPRMVRGELPHEIVCELRVVEVSVNRGAERYRTGFIRGVWPDHLVSPGAV